MALETVDEAVNNSTFTKVGDNVTNMSFKLVSKAPREMFVHVVAPGGTAPTIGDPAVPEDGTYVHVGVAADIYVLSRADSARIVGVRV